MCRNSGWASCGYGIARSWPISKTGSLVDNSTCAVFRRVSGAPRSAAASDPRLLCEHLHRPRRGLHKRRVKANWAARASRTCLPPAVTIGTKSSPRVSVAMCRLRLLACSIRTSPKYLCDRYEGRDDSASSALRASYCFAAALLILQRQLLSSLVRGLFLSVLD